MTHSNTPTKLPLTPDHIWLLGVYSCPMTVRHSKQPDDCILASYREHMTSFTDWYEWVICLSEETVRGIRQHHTKCLAKKEQNCKTCTDCKKGTLP
jgi:hypothetical protein